MKLHAKWLDYAHKMAALQNCGKVLKRLANINCVLPGPVSMDSSLLLWYLMMGLLIENFPKSTMTIDHSDH